MPEIERVHYDPVCTFLYAIAYHALGRKKESDALLSELIAKYQAIDSYPIAQVYAFRNQSDEAFVWLDRAYAKHDDGLIFTKVDPLLKSLHSDPRFAAVLKKLNLTDLTNRGPRGESWGQRLSGVGSERNNVPLHAAEITVASHRAAEIE